MSQNEAVRRMTLEDWAAKYVRDSMPYAKEYGEAVADYCAALWAENHRLRAGIEKLRDEAENEARDETSRVNDAPTYYARRLTELLEDK